MFWMAVYCLLMTVALPATAHSSAEASLSVAEASEEIASSLPEGLFPAAAIARIDARRLGAVAEELTELPDLEPDGRDVPFEELIGDDPDAQVYMYQVAWVANVLGDIAERLSMLENADEFFLAVTPQSQQSFYQAARIVPWSPVESFPKSVHIRLVAVTDGSHREALFDEVQTLAADLEFDDSTAHTVEATARGAAIDVVTPGTGGVDAERKLRALREVDIETPEPTTALVDFARSDAPFSLYINYPNMGRLIALGRLYPSLPLIGAVRAPGLTINEPELRERWQDATMDVHRSIDLFGGATAEFFDASIRLAIDDGAPAARVVSTHTDYGAELADALEERRPTLPQHPEDPVWELEFGADNPSALDVLRDAHEHLEVDVSREDLLAPGQNWSLFNQPGQFFVDPSLYGIVPDAPIAARVTFHRAEDVGDADDEYADELVIVASGRFEHTKGNREQFEELFRRHGRLYAVASVFAWRGDSMVTAEGDELLVRYVFNASVDEVFDANEQTRPARFRHRVDGRAFSELGFSSLGGRRETMVERLFENIDGDDIPPAMEFEAETYDGFAVTTVGNAPGSDDIESLPQLQGPQTAECVDDIRDGIARYKEEISSDDADQRGRQWVDAVDELTDRAADCREVSGEPGLDVAMARLAWFAGFQLEEQLRYRDALDLYEKGCERGEDAACAAADEVESVVDAPMPETDVDDSLRARERITMPLFDHGTVVFGGDNRLQIGDDSVAIDELAGQGGRERVEALIDDHSLRTPLILGEFDNSLWALEDRYDIRPRVMRRIALVAPPETDAVEMIRAFAQLPSHERIALSAVMETPDGARFPTVPMHPNVVDELQADADVLRDVTDDGLAFIVGDEGLDIVNFSRQARAREESDHRDSQFGMERRDDNSFDDGQWIEPVEDCADDGPTICWDGVDADDIPDAIVDGMAELKSDDDFHDRWSPFRSRRIVIAVDIDEMSWQTLTRLTRMLSHPHHPQWEHEDRRHYPFDDIPVIVEQ